MKPDGCMFLSVGVGNLLKALDYQLQLVQRTVSTSWKRYGTRSAGASRTGEYIENEENMKNWTTAYLKEETVNKQK